MKTYNNFLNEFFQPDKWCTTISLNKNDFNKLLNENCSDVDLEKDKPIYRSLNLTDDYYIIKSNSERTSAYTTNYYTMLINNLSSWNEFPKRNHICANLSFQFNRSVYKVIPFNGSKIGICPNDDIQAPFSPERAAAKILTNEYNINGFLDLNNFYDNFSYEAEDKNETIDQYDWEKFKIDIVREREKFPKRKKNDLLNIDKLSELFKPEGLGFKSVLYNEYKTMDLDPAEKRIHSFGYEFGTTMHEVWLDGDILLKKWK
jgi:hypothetical protein